MDMNGIQKIVEGLKEEILRDVKEMKEDFHNFKKEDFAPLVEKVGKIQTKVAWIVGGFSVLNIVVLIIFKLLLT